MSSWLNKAAILRDLSRAQGSVPVDVAGAVVAAEKPPTPMIEELEDEFFIRNYEGCNGHLEKPDLGLIKHMLNMVQEYNSPIDSDADKVVEICNISSLHLGKSMGKAGAGEPAVLIPQKETPKKLSATERKPRNVAIMSLLQNQAKEGLSTANNEALYKPKTVKTAIQKPKNGTTLIEKPKTVKKAIDKVNIWLDTQDKQKESNLGRNGMLNLDSFMVFKKRSNAPKASKPIEECTAKSPSKNFNNYVPSEKALEYYKRCQKNMKMKELVVEDMWTQVEKQMKSIDELKKKFSECLKSTRGMTSVESASIASEFNEPKFNEVRLPQHRHTIADECIVCAVKLFNEERMRETDKWWIEKQPQEVKFALNSECPDFC